MFTNGLSSFGFVTVLIFLLVALLDWATGGRIAPYPAGAINLSSPNLAPSLAHIFGTDFEGRDIFSRVLAALPVDLSIPLLIVFLSALMGIVLGTVAGYKGGFAEEAIMRLSDMFLAFPRLDHGARNRGHSRAESLQRDARPNIHMVAALCEACQRRSPSREVRGLYGDL